MHMNTIYSYLFISGCQRRAQTGRTIYRYLSICMYMHIINSNTYLYTSDMHTCIYQAVNGAHKWEDYIYVMYVYYTDVFVHI